MQPSQTHGYSPWRHALALLTSGATLFLVFAGGLVTSTGSGLAVPDWPLSYGMWFPPMVGGVFYEHGHRMIAGTVGLLMALLAIWTWVAEEDRRIRRLAGVALAAVVLQAVLGGLTVLFLLPTPISVAHACLGQAFFCLTVVLASLTGRTWANLPRPERDEGRPSLGVLTTVLVGVVFLQLLLGAVMRHMGAGLAIPDFPLAFGRLVPPLTSTAVTVHFLHRMGAIAVVLSAGWVIARILRSHDRAPRLRRPAVLLGALVSIQVILGAVTIWTGKAVLPTTLHVATGASILATSVLLALRSHHLLVTAHVRTTAPVAAPAGGSR